jgi:tetratricopeptide (TPR) repeat protein
MTQTPPDDPALRQSVAEKVEQAVGESPRVAAEWARTYADSLIDPNAAVARWDELTTAEERRLAERSDPQDARLVRNLLRWQADFLKRLDRDEEALAVMRRTVAVQADDRKEVIDTADWLMERQAWPVLEELAAKFPARFGEDALLLYRLAEAQRLRGADDLAEATAKQALQLQGITPPQRLETAYTLQTRQLYYWAEREYRQVLDSVAVTSEESLRARNFLAEMLHDRLEDLQAAKVLQDLVDVLDQDARASEQVEGPGKRDSSWPRARMHYFYAEHFGRAADFDRQAEHLKKATDYDPAELDALIARHRYSQADAKWTAETREMIDAAASQLVQQIDELRKHAGEPGEKGAQGYANTEMARHCNHYAWLISNTAGDFHKALELALEANRRSPNTAAYLDTLGRAYFAVGDLENAVKHQAKAVELEPHYCQIRRQLEFFREELAKAQKGAPAKASP